MDSFSLYRLYRRVNPVATYYVVHAQVLGYIMWCSEWSAVSETDTEGQARPLYCRSWGCDTCRPMRQAALIALAINGHPNTFITLTVNPAVEADPVARARALVAAWRTIRRRAIKAFSLPGLPFIAVFEATKAGEPHLHILARVSWLPQRWLSDQMRELTGAPIVDIRRIDEPSVAAGYVAKYAGKSPQRFGSCRRYWTSQDWTNAEWKANRAARRGEHKWVAVNTRFDRLEHAWRAVHAFVWHDSTGAMHWRDWDERVNAMADLYAMQR